jgi:tRNA A64-2'-O-ribosylphosphate transferase
MPDALSKTIPIWCAVLNQTLFGQRLFFTPPNVVSESEHSQIESKIDQFTNLFNETGFDIGGLKSKLTLPLRPIWVTPDGYLPDSRPEFCEFYPVVLCTASRMVQDGTESRQGYTYVQGAADDHEMWAELLTPQILWQHIDSLAKTEYTDSQLYDMISSFASQKVDSCGASDITHILPTKIWVGKTQTLLDGVAHQFGCIVDVSQSGTTTTEMPKNYLHHKLSCGKKGSKELRSYLPKLIELLESTGLFKKSILILCDSGSDLSVGIALAVHCSFYSTSGEVLEARRKSYLDKASIRQRLVQIITQRKVNPSRSTLNAVNSYLMG